MRVHYTKQALQNNAPLFKKLHHHIKKPVSNYHNHTNMTDTLISCIINMPKHSVAKKNLRQFIYCDTLFQK